jgi:uncharacterized protein (DUF433 family)
METNVTLEQMAQELETLQQQVSTILEKLEKMTRGYSTPVFYTDHPHIVRVQGVQGGDPIVFRAGRTVRGIVELSRQMSLEQLVQEYEGSLTPAQLFDALSYYYDHPGEIDQYIAENNAALERFEHPDHAYVMKHSGINGGEPSLRNSKVTVREIVERTRAGETVDDLVRSRQFLNRAQVYDALSYYYDHTEEIDEYIRKHEESTWQSLQPVSS